ncbi:MAG: baseplate J/gp47 family protein, partial [Nannocystaceae bacterium]
KKLGAAGQIARVHCLTERNLESSKPLESAPGRVSLIVLPKAGKAASQPLRNNLWDFFEPRRLLTTRLHVVSPRYIDLKINAHLYLNDGASRAGVVAEVGDVLTTWFDPHVGGDDRAGWPFGGNVYLSSVYRNLDNISGIDFVKNVQVTTTAKQRTLLDADNHVIGLRIDPHELVAIAPKNIAVTLHEFAAGEWREVSS